MNYICNCQKINFQNNEYAYWEDRNVTTDELDVVNFLKKLNNLNSKSILHIGVGSSYFAKNFSKENQIIGLTVSQKEINKAKELNYLIFLKN